MTMQFFRSADRPAYLNEREGLTTYLRAGTTRAPVVLPAEERDALTKTELHAYNRARLIHVSGGIMITTSQLAEAKKALTRLIAANSGRNSGHHGLMITGGPGLGKTTICKALMRHVFKAYSRQFPNFEDHGQVPVVFVEVPAGCTGKLLMTAFARFFGLTIARSDTMDSIRHRVVRELNTAGTQLVVVDELHNLAAANRGNGESVDILKELHNQVGATFVYAGIDLINSALLAGARGRQLSARFAALELTQFENNGDHMAEWRGIVQQFGRELPLSDQSPDDLIKISSHLRDLTGGSIGSLGRLLADVSIDLIHSPGTRPETITRELLDAQRLDMAAAADYANPTL